MASLSVPETTQRCYGNSFLNFRKKKKGAKSHMQMLDFKCSVHSAVKRCLHVI